MAGGGPAQQAQGDAGELGERPDFGDFAIAFMELAERGPDDLAGVVVAPSGDELLDEAFKVVGKRDVHAANY